MIYNYKVYKIDDNDQQVYFKHCVLTNYGQKKSLIQRKNCDAKPLPTESCIGWKESLFETKNRKHGWRWLDKKRTWMTLYELGKKNVKGAVWKIAFLSVKDNVEIQLWKGEWENYTTKIIVIEITICVNVYNNNKIFRVYSIPKKSTSFET